MHIQDPYNALAGYRGYGCCGGRASPMVGMAGLQGLGASDDGNGGGGAISDVLHIGGDVLSFFGSSDKTKDKERFDRVNRTYQLALAGGITPEGIPAETCLRGMAEVDGKGSSTNLLCAVGSTAAVKYAKQVWQQYVQIHGAASTPALPQFPTGGGIIPSTPQQALTSPLVWGLVGLAGLWYATKPKGRR